MNEKVNRLIRAALAKGACSGSDKVSDYKSLVWMLFSPQGREFCEENNFPALSDLEAIKAEVEPYGVFVNSGYVHRNNQPHIALMGDTEATLEYSDVSQVYKIILMHGAKAKIKASNYAVLQITNIGGCKVEIEKDKTVVIL